MQVRFWGVRGSVPTAGPAFTRVGGHTSCVQVQVGDERLILDGGTGLRPLGEKLLADAKRLGRRIRATLLFSHLHWDHIQGFPFFRPAFSPDAEFSLVGPVTDDGRALEDVLCDQMLPPTFPVPLGAMAARKSFHTVRCGDVLEVGPFVIHARALRHPQGSLGFRIEAHGRALCFATDTEPPDDGTVDEALVELGRNVDLLIHDAQYTEAEYHGVGGAGPCRRGWGHSTNVVASQVARAVGAKRLMLFHHDPTHDDDIVAAIAQQTRTRFLASHVAREGQRIEL